MKTEYDVTAGFGGIALRDRILQMVELRRRAFMDRRPRGMTQPREELQMTTAKRGLIGAAVVVSSLALGWAGGAYSSARAPGADAKNENAAPRATVARAVSAPEAHEVSEAFVGVAERVAPSVVRITTRQSAPAAAKMRAPRLNPFEGTPFERFFEDFGDAPLAPPGPRPGGMGSGVVIDDQGHILTNNHVVENAAELKVTFVDGKEISAKIVGTDPKTDLAVIKVERAAGKPAEFGDASRLRVGEWVMAIGNPFGLDHSVTVGVLSAKNRYGFAPGKLEDFLQTDASINPGNSGGPLVNLSGQIVGINTMIAGLGTGVGFAVSESIARPIARQLIEHGKVTRPYIGIVMQSVTPELKRALGAKAPEKGALVSEVQKGSPAEKSGIQVGDIVLRVNGTATSDSREVQQAVLGVKVGEKVEVTVWRDGKELTLDVRTAELPAEAVASVEPGGREHPLGLGLQTLTPELAARLGVPRAQRGAVVTEVRPGSVAAEAGIREGDVLASVDRKPISTAEEAVKQLSEKRSGGHLVRILRGDAALFIGIPNPGDEK